MSRFFTHFKTKPNPLTFTVLKACCFHLGPRSYRKVEQTHYSCLHAVAIFYHFYPSMSYQEILVICGLVLNLLLRGCVDFIKLHIPSLEFPGEKWCRWMKMVKYCYCMQARIRSTHSFYLSKWLWFGSIQIFYFADSCLKQTW